MAVYVTSDAHGHLRALDRVLEQVSLGTDDALFVLGDMIDRGPEPAGVLKLVHSLPNAHVLLGNHERMMLDVLVGGGDELDALTWDMNGGYTTSGALEALPREEYLELVDWVANLPLFAVVETADLRRSAAPGARRSHMFCHAGVDALALRATLAMAGVVPSSAGGYDTATSDDLLDAMALQSEDDLLWIRKEFWSEATGLVGRDGRGPVVVAGHTPSISLAHYGSLLCGNGMDEQDRGIIVEVGATRDTGGVPDRICIDCSAAAGAPAGQVGIMRLEDRATFYASVLEGE